MDPAAVPRSRGVLRSAGPGSVTLDRLPPSEHLSSLVRHHWFARWSIPPGEVREQGMLEYPSGNLLIDARGMLLGGPSPERSTARLEGVQWVHGVLLQPSALFRIGGPPVERLVGAAEPVPDGAEVADRVAALLGRAASPPAPLDPHLAAEAVAVVDGWLTRFVDPADAEGDLVSRVVAVVEDDPGLTRVADLASRVGFGERALQRLVRRRLGVSPKWLISRRRMQDAADRLHRGDRVDLARLAIELGFADQAHFGREFASVTGLTPAAYRDAEGDPL